MWLVGKGRLKLKVEQCRNDTPKTITELIRQCTEFHREQRPNFSPEVIIDRFYLFSNSRSCFFIFL